MDQVWLATKPTVQMAFVVLFETGVCIRVPENLDWPLGVKIKSLWLRRMVGPAVGRFFHDRVEMARTTEASSCLAVSHIAHLSGWLGSLTLPIAHKSGGRTRQTIKHGGEIPHVPNDYEALLGVYQNSLVGLGVPLKSPAQRTSHCPSQIRLRTGLSNSSRASPDSRTSQWSQTVEVK